MKTVALAIVMAIIVEGLVSYGETIFDYFEKGDTKKAIKQLCAIVLGVGLAFSAKIELISYLTESTFVPLLDMVLGGIFISRGSNYLFDLIKRIREGQKQAELSAETMRVIGFADENEYDDEDVEDEIIEDLSMYAETVEEPSDSFVEEGDAHGEE